MFVDNIFTYKIDIKIVCHCLYNTHIYEEIIFLFLLNGGWGR